MIQEEIFVGQFREKRSKNRLWTKVLDFESAKLAEEYVEAEDIWKKCSFKRTLEGGKLEYRCKYGKYRKEECPAKIYLLYHATNETVSLYSTECEHTHPQEAIRGLDDTIKKFVTNLFRAGIEKPNAILAAMRKEILAEPSKTKLIAFLRQLRAKKHEPPKISGYQLKKWCEERSHLPKLNESPFVLDYSIKYESCNKTHLDMKIVISTVRLLEQLHNSEMVQLDTTYKLLWQGFGIIVIGASDKNKVFHPFAIAICKNESEDDFHFIFTAIRKYYSKWKPKFLLTDASVSITNGFIKTFGTPEVNIVCFSHVLRSIKKKLRGISVASEIKNDIHLMQTCNSKLIFNKASRLLMEKWQKENDQNINEFLNYFEEQWLQINPNWFEGAAVGFPSTNMAIEEINSKMKKEHTLRERLPAGQFLSKLEDLLVKWSKERDTNSVNYQEFSLQTSVTLKEWVEAYRWLLINKKILKVADRYYICSSKSNYKNITIELAQYHERYENWKTFEQFIKFYYGIWVISIHSDIQKCSCTCPTFSKNYKCKHILGLQIHLQLKEVPEEAKCISLDQNRKRGRPPKVKRL